MGKYLNPKADLTFKKIFGEHPHLVISLLNASKAYVAQTEAGEPYEHHDYRTNCENYRPRC